MKQRGHALPLAARLVALALLGDVSWEVDRRRGRILLEVESRWRRSQIYLTDAELSLLLVLAQVCLLEIAAELYAGETVPKSGDPFGNGPLVVGGAGRKLLVRSVGWKGLTDEERDRVERSLFE